MSKLDEMIRDALAEEDRALVSETGELGFFAQLLGQLRGRNAWVSWATSGAIFFYAALGIWTGWNFFAQTEVLAALKWGMSTAVIVVVIGMLKLYLLSEMQTNRVMRELKRVELMLAAREN